MGKTWRMVETGYRELIIMRHAKTEREAASDRARRLTSRGRADARAAGRWLRENELVPDLVLVSPAARALATAEIASAGLAASPEVRVVESLYGASADDVVEILRATDRAVSRVLVIGHNPTMEELASNIQRHPDDASTPDPSSMDEATTDLPRTDRSASDQSSTDQASPEESNTDQASPEQSSAELSTSGLVVLQVPGEWADLAFGTAKLIRRHTPRG
jgi:phosphohistidine phosphatase